MRNKKIYVCAIVATLALGLVGCGGNNEKDSDDSFALVKKENTNVSSEAEEVVVADDGTIHYGTVEEFFKTEEGLEYKMALANKFYEGNPGLYKSVSLTANGNQVILTQQFNESYKDYVWTDSDIWENGKKVEATCADYPEGCKLVKFEPGEIDGEISAKYVFLNSQGKEVYSFLIE